MTVFRPSSRSRGSFAAPLSDWYRTGLGAEVARQEAECVQRLLNNVFGYHLVQLGADAHFEQALAASRIRRHFRLVRAMVPGASGAHVLGLPERLPFASDSIDAVLVAHTLDFNDTPRAVLAEIERILVPDGRMLILGFNAMSPWGLRRVLAPSRACGPWCGHFRTSAQVGAWLAALGCEVEHCEHLMLPGPLRSRQVRSSGTGCDAVYRRRQRGPWSRLILLRNCFRPLFGGVYVIRAVKRDIALTPLRPARTRAAGLLVGGAVRPSTRIPTMRTKRS